MFKPMLAPNEEINLEEIKYPIMASYKLDGIRCIINKGEILSRSLKPIQNKQLKEKLKPLADYSKRCDYLIDGEIYSPKLTFQEITSYVMTEDFTDSKSIKKYGEIKTIPEHLKFHIFDIVDNDNFEKPFQERFKNVIYTSIQFPKLAEDVYQYIVKDKTEIEKLFDKALKEGKEGLILKNPNGIYKCGRGTLKEGLIYKVKPYTTFDAKIEGVVQATKVDPKAEKKTNELGRSVTSKKKNDRIPIDKASAFMVQYENKELKVVIALTDKEKEEIWNNKNSYIGKTIEFKGMLVGAKDLPRHPIFLRFRNDKD